MKVDRVKVSKEFFILGAGEWITMESPVAEDEDAVECARELRDKIISVYEYGSEDAKFPNREPEKVINREEERVVLLMEDAQTLEELAKFKGQCNTPELNRTYMQKVKEITTNLMTYNNTNVKQ